MYKGRVLRINYIVDCLHYSNARLRKSGFDSLIAKQDRSWLKQTVESKSKLVCVRNFRSETVCLLGKRRYIAGVSGRLSVTSGHVLMWCRADAVSSHPQSGFSSAHLRVSDRDVFVWHWKMACMAGKPSVMSSLGIVKLC